MRKRSISADWKKRLETSIISSESPWAGDLLADDEFTRNEVADPNLQKTMLQLLRRPTATAAIEYLWAQTNNRPDLHDKVVMYFHRAIYWLAKYAQPIPRDRSAAEIQSIIKSLKAIQKDLSNNRLVLSKHNVFMRVVDDLVNEYKALERSARVTKPKDRQKQAILCILRSDFSSYFGNPMNQAVAYLMEAAFGGLEFPRFRRHPLGRC